MSVFRALGHVRWWVPGVLVVALVPLSTQAQADEGSRTPSPVAVQALAETQTLTGAITGGDGFQTGRIVRDGHEHGCETPTAMPGLQNATPVHADTYNLQNTHNEARCIVVEANFAGCAGGSTQVNAYSAYSAAAPASGVIGATGFSTTASGTFGFPVAANASYTLAVHETVPSAGCPAYSIKVTNAPLAATVTQAVGANPAAISSTVDAFKAALGGASDRRDITWDEVPEAGADPANLPLDYYNTTSAQGLSFTTPSQIRVSSNGVNAPAEFGSINANNPTIYQPYSGIRLFTPVNATQTDFAFRMPGTANAAPVRAFGTVLVNPGFAGFVLPRDAAGDPLGVYVPPSNSGLGFYGLTYPNSQVYSMSLVGSLTLGGAAGTVFDDFIYSEPGLRLAAGATGPGTVSGGGIQCPGTCTKYFAPSAGATLTANPGPDAGFVGWGGACSGTVRTCQLTMSEDRSATATFRSCATQKAAVASKTKAVQKAKKAKKAAKKAVATAHSAAELAQAQAKLAKAKKKLKKAKAKLKTAKAAFTTCVS